MIQRSVPVKSPRTRTNRSDEAPLRGQDPAFGVASDGASWWAFRDTLGLFAGRRSRTLRHRDQGGRLRRVRRSPSPRCDSSRSTAATEPLQHAVGIARVFEHGERWADHPLPAVLLDRMDRSSALGGIAKSLTCLCHSNWRQRGNETSKRIAPNRVDVVEVHDAVGRNSVIVDRQLQLGYQCSCGASERGNDHSTDSISDRIACEDEDGSVTAGRGSEPNVTALHRPSPTNPQPDPSRRSRRAPPQNCREADRSMP
jgi:hypothetical protein